MGALRVPVEEKVLDEMSKSHLRRVIITCLVPPPYHLYLVSELPTGAKAKKYETSWSSDPTAASHNTEPLPV